VGQNATLRHASKSDVGFALARAQIAPELQTAVLGNDQQHLEALLGVGSLYCMQFIYSSNEVATLS
jgi:hypothetical protein